MDTIQLTREQRELVSRNVGLVGVHLRRCVRAPAGPTRRCEREDLYQEGCLALVRAATEYDPSRHGAFQGYAINRIHSAVSQAIYEKFATVHVPYQVARGHRPDPRAPGVTTDAVGSPPRRSELRARTGDGVVSGVDLSRLAARPARTGHGETLGDRLRELIAAHGEAAATEMIGRTRGRDDRERMVRSVLHERVLVPEAEGRRPLRQFARELSCSASRIVACEQRLLALLRERLDHDAGYACLRELAADRPEGFDGLLTDRDDAELAAAELEQFDQTFAAGEADERGEMLIRLADRVSGGAGRLARVLYSRLPARERRDRRFTLWPKSGVDERATRAG